MSIEVEWFDEVPNLRASVSGGILKKSSSSPIAMGRKGKQALYPVSVTHLVPVDRGVQVLVAFWVLVVGPDKDALLTCRNGEWPNASHDIGHNLPWFEQVD